jgi:methyl-accepting chemotaxis protein
MMVNRTKEKSLKTPLFIAVLVAILSATLITAIAILLNFYVDFERNLYKDVKNIAIKLSDDIQKMITFGLTVYDIPNIKGDLDKIVRENEYITYIVITDNNGIVLISNEDSLVSQNFSYKNNEKINYKGETAINLFKEVFDNVTREKKYVIHVGLKKSYLNRKLYNSLLLTVFISLITVLIVFFVFKKILEKRLVKPINILKNATTKISEGDLTVTIDIGFNDEIGVLAENFTSMVNEINNLVYKLKESIDKLKKIGDVAGDLSFSVNEGSVIQRNEIGLVRKIYLDIADRIKALKLKVNSLNDFLELTTSTFLELSVSFEEIERMMEELLGILVKIEDTYTKLKNINIKLNEGASILDKEVESILSFVSQMESSIKMTFSNIRETSKMAEKINKLAEESRTVTKTSIESINKMVEVTVETKNAFNVLRDNINKITSMLDIINEIAEQTNMLALNAAIIATQSSESGKAFTIVADEIKNLSRRTQKSTYEISNLIHDIISQTENVYLKLQESVNEGNVVVERSKEVENKISVIIDLINKLSESMEIILKAANEQAEGSANLRNGVEELKTISNTLINVKDDAMNIGKTINDLFNFIVNVTNRVSTSIKEQNKSIANVKESFVGLGGFSKELLEHIDKEENELKSSEETLLNVYKLSDENAVKSKNLERKLIELKEQIVLFQEITQKFILK